MRMRWLTIVMAAVLAGGGASPAAAQGKKGAPAGPRRAPVRPPRPQANRELDRFVKMPPEERHKELEKLPPQRRERMEQRLERYQRDLEQELADVSDVIKRLREGKPQETATV